MIHGRIHRAANIVDASLPQPCTCGVEQRVGGFLIVLTFKKTKKTTIVMV
ncbi:MAG: hypothetical protein K6C40_04335 [Thermoguttaceae bacterium]|nr:hypothetical protein [Thermoguttaceae bacterium]